MKLFGTFTLVAFVAVLVIVGPLLTLWMLNTLFATGLEYDLTNWAAALIFNLTIAGSKTKVSK